MNAETKTETPVPVPTFNFAAARTVAELTTHVRLIAAVARIGDAELTAHIKECCERLNRVGSPVALGLVVVVDGALRQALDSRDGSAARSASLKSLMLWVSGINLGWL